MWTYCKAAAIASAARSPSAKAPPAVPHCSRDRASPANTTLAHRLLQEVAGAGMARGTTAQEPARPGIVAPLGHRRHGEVAQGPAPDLLGQGLAHQPARPVGPGAGRVEPGGQGHVELEIVERRPVDPRQQARRLEAAPTRLASRSRPRNGEDGQCSTTCS